MATRWSENPPEAANVVSKTIKPLALIMLVEIAGEVADTVVVPAIKLIVAPETNEAVGAVLIKTGNWADATT